MKAEILSVGTELLLGDIVNTDAQFLARELARLGFTVLYHSTVGDNEERLSDLLQTALSRSDLVLTTGGLGPTADDLTKEVCAKVLGIPLVEDAESMRRMEAFFQARGQEMPETNRKQAFLPQGCVVFRNDHGTAPGCAGEQGGKIVINLPGPPRELKPMFLEQALPYLSRFAGGVIVSHTVRTFGIGESAMAERAAQFLAQENPTVAPYAKDGEALLRVTAKANSQAEADALCKPTVEALCALYGKLVYGVDVGSLQQAVVQMLRGRGLKIGLAESCTAGLIAKRITEIPGSSEVLECGIVSYSNRIKEEVLGVSPATIETYGVISAETAAEMAAGALRISGAEIGLGVTGLAGPDGDDHGNPAGLAFIALTDGAHTLQRTVHTGRGGDNREYNRFVISSHALDLIRLYLLEYQ